jgi:hypothetical protein
MMIGLAFLFILSSGAEVDRIPEVDRVQEVDRIRKVETMYYEGRYQEAIEHARMQLGGNPYMSPEDEIRLRQFIAFSQVAVGERVEAQKEFRVILEMDSSFTLDPQLVSPNPLNCARR